MEKKSLKEKQKKTLERKKAHFTGRGFIYGLPSRHARSYLVNARASGAKS